MALEVGVQRREPGFLFFESRRQSLDLSRDVGRLALCVGRGALRVALQGSCLELLLTGALRPGSRFRERGFGGAELAQGPLERAGGCASTGFRLARFLIQRVELRPSLQRSAPRAVGAGEEDRAIRAPERVAAFQNFVAGEQGPYPGGRRSIHA